MNNLNALEKTLLSAVKLVDDLEYLDSDYDTAPLFLALGGFIEVANKTLLDNGIEVDVDVEYWL